MSDTGQPTTRTWAGRVLAHAPSWLAAASLFALMIMTFLDVILRSTISNPITAATELTHLFMAIIVFSALPVITWKNTHITVDLLDPLFPAMAARIRDVVIDLACGVILMWPAWRVLELAERTRSYGDVTEYLHWPQFYIEYFIAVSTFVTAFVLLARAVVGVVAPSRLPKATAI